MPKQSSNWSSRVFEGGRKSSERKQVRVSELQRYRGSLQGWPWAYEKARPNTHKLKEMGLTIKL